MQVTKEKIVIRNKFGKLWFQKHYLTLTLKEAHALFLKSCKQEGECSFSTFPKYSSRNVVLLRSKPKEQCKFQLMKTKQWNQKQCFVIMAKPDGMLLPLTFWSSVNTDKTTL